MPAILLGAILGLLNAAFSAAFGHVGLFGAIGIYVLTATTTVLLLLVVTFVDDAE